MPGVPSSRGCDGCRKQKKKCDQGQPKCSRCKRLNIECIGSGKQRYKFQTQALAKVKFADHLVIQISPQATLSSPGSRTGSRLVHLMGTEDLRYDIVIHGDTDRLLWSMIPRRLGASEALDAAARAFVYAHANSHTGIVSPDSILAYKGALKSVRTALSDPEQIYTSNVLCAVFLVMMTQSLVDRPGDLYVDHAEAIAHMLPGMINQGWTPGTFEHAILVSSCALVITASTYNHTIPIDRSLTLLLQDYTHPCPWASDRGNPLRSLILRNLLRFPYFSREPENYLMEIREAYSELREDLPEVRKRLEQLRDGQEAAIKVAAALKVSVAKHYAQFQVAYGLMLSLAMFLNAILCACDGPRHPESSFLEEGVELRKETLKLGHDMLYLRPLFSRGLGNTLMIAWALETDEMRLMKIENLLVQFRRDSVGDQWYAGGLWLREYVEKLRARSRRAMAGSSTTSETSTLTDEGWDSFPAPVVGRCAVL